MKKKILTLEEGFIHDVREILSQRTTDEKKVLKLLSILFMYDTMKEVQKIWPESKKLVEQIIEEYNGGEAE